ncbi:hypothetical protein Tco_0876785 [Tanacetum coccineum]|uniref:Uncharacterized protein n=1 Tax=Tanacetum coccineum TaxID=301880 RepID=A0ABQ5BUY6_9ASTR
MNQHLLRFSLVASALVPWIYIQQLWHTIKLDDSKDKFKFFIDTKEFQFSADDFPHVPMTHSHPIDSTKGTHRTPSAPRPPNPVEHQGESSTPRKSTIIRIPIRRQSDPETLIPTAAEIDITNPDEATQMSNATARSLKDLEAQESVKTVEERLVDEELEKIMEG